MVNWITGTNGDFGITDPDPARHGVDGRSWFASRLEFRRG